MPELFIHYCVYLLYGYVVNMSRLSELPEQQSCNGEWDIIQQAFDFKLNLYAYLCSPVAVV